MRPICFSLTVHSLTELSMVSIAFNATAVVPDDSLSLTKTVRQNRTQENKKRPRLGLARAMNSKTGYVLLIILLLSLQLMHIRTRTSHHTFQNLGQCSGTADVRHFI